MYELSWRTVSALTRVLFWYLFPSLLCNSGNKQQSNPLVSAETIRHSSSYIILYLFQGLVGCFLFLEFYSSAHMRISLVSCSINYINKIGNIWLKAKIGLQFSSSMERK